MKINTILSIKIAILILLFSSITLFLGTYFFSGTTSIKLFFTLLLQGFEVRHYIFLGISSLLYGVGVYTICYAFTSKILDKMEIQSEKLKDYNHFLAHELKTPITIIQSNLDVLEYGYKKENITSSKEQLGHMVHIIDGLLLHAESSQRVDRTEVNIENCIKKFKNSFFTAGEIVIENKLFNKSILTDELLFTRVIQNLLENALKYSSDNRVVVEILDDKINIENIIDFTLTSAEIENILKKNYTLGVKHENSHGIGLGMTKQIVEALGFDLEIISQNNKFIAQIQLKKEET